METFLVLPIFHWFLITVDLIFSRVYVLFSLLSFLEGIEQGLLTERYDSKSGKAHDYCFYVKYGGDSANLYR